jgi:lantibiotic modifying enzyme
MGTEAAYHRLLAWLNERGAPLPFKVLEVLDRSTHGWVEFVEHLPCRDHDEARRYYERAGMLLCLIYVLEGTDCHHENIIASGEYPVLIDAETLMHHRARAVVPEDENAQTEAFGRLGHSVLRTGLLPAGS